MSSITELESIWDSFLKYIETTCDLGSRIQRADSKRPPMGHSNGAEGAFESARLDISIYDI